MKSACTFLYLNGVEGDYRRTFPDWTSNFCLLGSGKISCFEIDPRTAPKGKIPLANAQVAGSDKNVPGSQYSATECFKITTPDRVYHIFAETHDNRNKWVALLNSHIAKVKSGALPPPDNFQLRDQIVAAERVEYLTKSGGLRDLSWKRRLFVLNAGFLVYYELPPGLRSKGNIVCQSCTDAPDAQVPSFIDVRAVMKVQAERGALYIAAASLLDKERWKAALNIPSATEEPSPATAQEPFVAPPTELPENEVPSAVAPTEPTAATEGTSGSVPATTSTPSTTSFGTGSLGAEDEKSLLELRDVLNKFDLGRFLRAFVAQGFTSVVTLKHLTPELLAQMADENNMSPAHRAQLNDFYAFHNVLAKYNLEKSLGIFLQEGCDSPALIAAMDDEDVNHFGEQCGLGRFDVKKLKKMVDDLKQQ